MNGNVVDIMPLTSLEVEHVRGARVTRFLIYELARSLGSDVARRGMYASNNLDGLVVVPARRIAENPRVAILSVHYLAGRVDALLIRPFLVWRYRAAITDKGIVLKRREPR